MPGEEKRGLSGTSLGSPCALESRWEVVWPPSLTLESRWDMDSLVVWPLSLTLADLPCLYGTSVQCTAQPALAFVT